MTISPQKNVCDEFNQKVLVTSGPTRAYIDRVRYIANTSTGALGACIVEKLVEQGIPVIHLYGMGSELPKVQNSHLLETVEIVTIDDVIACIKTIAISGHITAVVHAMAILDYIPEFILEGKKNSGDAWWDIRLVRTPKVISLIRELIPYAYMVGFKLETGVSEEELFNRARILLNTYKLDIVVANDLDRVSKDRHEAIFVASGDKILTRAVTKEEIARTITAFIEKTFKRAVD
ncbi:MAG TPA: phosphopantothenoylcysteine decarboxylase [Anaerolineae bacterium]|nr:phosphopantothenoylcysteine decarboxylase [Anaerolineae bacterium]